MENINPPQNNSPSYGNVNNPNTGRNTKSDKDKQFPNNSTQNFEAKFNSNIQIVQLDQDSNHNNNNNIENNIKNINHEIDPDDFIINIEDGDRNTNRASSTYSPYQNNRITPPDINPEIKITSGKQQFTKTVIMLSSTEEKKENDGDIHPKIEGGTNFTIRDNMMMMNSNAIINNNNRNSNPRQKKQIPSSTGLNSKTQSDNNEYVLFFFINKMSGVGQGKNIISMGVKKVEFSDNLRCTAYIFEMNDEAQCLNGIETLRNELNRISLVKVIIGGGDGSVLDFIEKLNSNHVDVNRCIFGVLPLGRSNDLSRELGWGEDMDITSDMAKFKVIVHDLAEATSVLIDVWDIKLTCDETEGAIVEWNKESVKSLKRDEFNKQITTLKKSFITYFSMGFDARVGFGYNKKHSSCKCCNSCSFFWEGCKKNCCRKTLPVNGFIESFLAVKLDKEAGGDGTDDTLNNITMKENEAPKETIFKTISLAVEEQKKKEREREMTNINMNIDQPNADGDSSSSHNIIKIGKKEYENVILKGEPMGLVCQNIRFFIGGPSNLWKESGDKFGLETFDPKLDKNDKKAVEVKNTLVIK
jgi:hypothetical protein